MILLWEGYVYIHFLANLGTYQLILKAWDKAVGTDLQRIILALAASKSLAINKALEIQSNEIILCNSSAFLSLNHISLTVQHTSQLKLYSLVINLVLLNINLQTLVVAQLNLWLLGSSNLEHQILAQLLGGNIELRTSYDINLLLLNSLEELLWSNSLNSLVQNVLLTYSTLNNLLRSLALAEARDVDLGSNLLVCSLISLIQLSSWYSNFQFYLRVFQFLYINFHCVK